MRWLPIDFIFNRTNSLVRWIDFGTKELTEPFFDWTLNHLKHSEPPAHERVTSTELFLRLADTIPAVVPSGLIFHISRCGSTLLSNFIRAGKMTLSLSEPRVLEPFFATTPFIGAPHLATISNNARKTFLDIIISLYSDRGAFSGRSRVVLKCDGIGIFSMAIMRLVWPTVPFIILIRDPIEVIVSNLNKPARWIVERQHRCEFGWTSQQGHDMSSEEYSARLIGGLCEAAIAQVDDNCRIIDYANLNRQTLVSAAHFFGIDVQSVCVDDVLQMHASEPKRPKLFEADCEQKQRAATPLVRECARRWAERPYRDLKNLAAATENEISKTALHHSTGLQKFITGPRIAPENY